MCLHLAPLCLSNMKKRKSHVLTECVIFTAPDVKKKEKKNNKKNLKTMMSLLKSYVHLVRDTVT